MNGRINFKEGGTPLFLQDKILTDSRTVYDNLKYTQQNTALSNLYFSSKNMAIIQNAIRANVYNSSKEKYLIDEQNKDTLNIIMRSIYLQNSLNQPDNLTKQIEDLNKQKHQLEDRCHQLEQEARNQANKNIILESILKKRNNNQDEERKLY